MYIKTLKLANILEQMKADKPYNLEGVSQETIDAMVKKGLLIELPNL